MRTRWCGLARWVLVGVVAGVELSDLVLQGPRLTLRPWSTDDADDVHAIMADPHLHAFLPLPDPYTRDDALSFTGGAGDEGRTEGTGLGSAVVETVTGRLVGAAALRFPTRQHPADLGYWVAAAGRGNGYAAEASRVLTEWAFEHGVAERVTIRCAVANLASVRTALRAGFAYEGVQRREVTTPAGWTDGATFARLATDAGAPITPARPDLPGGMLSDGVLGLRVATPDDAWVLVEESHDPEGRRWAFDDHEPDDTLGAAAMQRAPLDWLVGGMGRLTMIDVATGEPAGTFQTRNAGPPGIAGIGYWVRPAFRGRGYTSRALRLFTGWAFGPGGLVRLELGAKRDNVASQRAAASGGFEPDGIRAARLRNPDGTYADEVRFALVAPAHRR